MPDTEQPMVEFTIIQNVRRSATRHVIFTFLINPLLSMWLFWHLVASRVGTEQNKHYFWLRFGSSFGYLLVSVTFIPIWAYERELQRLRTLGYEQRPTRQRQADLALNIGLCVAYYFWWKREHEASEEFTGWPRLIVAILAMWSGLTLFYMGQIWWFTVKVR